MMKKLNHCFVNGCKSGYPSEKKKNKSLGKKNPTLFSAPKDAQLLEAWRKAVPKNKKDKVLSSDYKICELHFENELILRNYETKLSDGTVFRMERGRFDLLPGSIPSIFPNLPRDLSKNKMNKRKAQTQQTFSKKLNVDNGLNVVACCESLSFSKLKVVLSDIVMPSNWWITSGDNYIICGTLNEKLQCERHVVISQDLSVKAFLRNNEVDLPVTKKIIDSVEEISTLLQKIDKLNICKDIQLEAANRRSHLKKNTVTSPKLQSRSAESKMLLKKKQKDILCLRNDDKKIHSKTIKYMNTEIDTMTNEDMDAEMHPISDKRLHEEIIEVKPEISPGVFSSNIPYDSNEAVQSFYSNTDINALPEIEEEISDNYTNNNTNCLSRKKSVQVLKHRLRKLSASNQKLKRCLKESQLLCELYKKENFSLKEVIDNLKEIISVSNVN